MTTLQICKYSLSALAALFIALMPGTAMAQMSDELKDQLFSAYESSTEEVNLGGGVKVRGHRIGGGKFLPCSGDPINIGDRPVRRSNPCQESGGTHAIRGITGVITSLDVENRILELRDINGTETFKIFLSPSLKLLINGRLKDVSHNMLEQFQGNRTVTVFSMIPGRAEAITEGGTGLLPQNQFQPTSTKAPPKTLEPGARCKRLSPH